jgi:membrane-bound metal-dependent hydrolase YbcI (DUF457 family)
MLGRKHLLLSIATVSVIIAPHVQTNKVFVFTILIGTAIGSLIPDVDASDAAIFHRDIKGLNGRTGKMFKTLVGPILPVFGYTTKYLIYKPAVKTLDLTSPSNYGFEEEHRAFSHSILGITTMTALTGIYITPILIAINLFAPLLLITFLLSYMTGAFLHILQDSCTKTGITWNQPFSKTKLQGQLTTGKNNKKTKYLLYLLTALAITVFLISSTSNIPQKALSAASTVSLGFSWFFFVKIIAKAEIVK